MKLVKPSFEILTNLDGNRILKSIEAAGRTCYKSEKKITNGSAEKFVRGVVKSGHHSVIEHEGISVRFICDRGVTHEMVRHRIAAFSQESTRYVTYDDETPFIIPKWSKLKEGEYPITLIPDLLMTKDPDLVWMKSMLRSEKEYKKLLSMGWKAQQARSVLPNSLKTEIVMTANLREWRHVFSLRCDTPAHPQIREVMLPLLDELHKKVPVVFDDLHKKFFGTND